MKRHVRSFLIPIVVLSLLTVGVGVAAAHSYSHDSRITNFRYNEEKDRFQGNVVSAKDACERNRVVRVFRQKNANDDLVASDKTNDHGFWATPDVQAHGNYYATVKRRVRTPDGNHRHVCGGDTTQTIFVE